LGRGHALQYLHLANLALVAPLQASPSQQGLSHRQLLLLRAMPSWHWWALRWGQKDFDLQVSNPKTLTLTPQFL
jgi:hypothetical protein